NPLLGKIWQVSKRRFISREELRQQVLMASLLLLGETHDNSDHHKYQAWIIKQLAVAGAKVSVAFEMINQSQGRLLKSTKFENATDLVKLLEKTASGWEYENYYMPIFSEAISAGFPIVAANLDRDSVVQIVMQGSEKIPPELKKLLDDSPLNKAQSDSLAKEISESHCNIINQQLIEGMTAGQRVRDAAIALALSRIDDAFIKVLIAGSGHTRLDRGVPFYLRRGYIEEGAKQEVTLTVNTASQRQTPRILSLSWLELEEGHPNPDYYAKRWNAEKLPFDIVWFTATADRPDPCEQFSKHMQKKNK
ncbi:MAG: ChaN family lipoprotein, partial [Thiohalomonadales bacterium]